MAQSFTRTEIHGIVRRVSLKDFAERSVLSFSIPYSESYKDKNTGEWKSTPTEWFELKIWGSKDNKWFQSAVANIVEGAFVIVSDAIRMTNKRENAKGETVTYIEYKVNKFQVVKGDVEKQPTQGGKAADRDGDMPF